MAAYRNLEHGFLRPAGISVMATAGTTAASSRFDYADALSKSILFFEGQRSGRLPPSQRMTWRKSSALRDGFDVHRDLVGGYYDAGDNVKFNFPMAFTTTMLSWSVIEFGQLMGPELQHALEAIRWGTDYLLKATRVPDSVVGAVGDPNADHSCWQRPEDMDTPRTSYVVSKQKPGSEVSAEIAAALAASSIVFRHSDRAYAAVLLRRAMQFYGRYMKLANKVVDCGNNVHITPARLVSFTRGQVDYILGSNPSGMSYMVGFGQKFPRNVHHRGSVLPSVAKHPQHIDCHVGYSYFNGHDPNQNVLTGAIVGGPAEDDTFKDSRFDAPQSEPTTSKKKKMQQRRSASGRPTGTDGSDFNYRMVVDSRYQKVAKGKSRLSALILIQVLTLSLSIESGSVIPDVKFGLFSLNLHYFI
ncbi:hypothetical protein GBA52_006361 [Prunus armeniaca]|nr:hypothetical protein GBA52_006361 [Prunus armeniaca]